MQKEIKGLEKVVVKNKMQLDVALQPFMNDTTIRKLLIEGMDIIKRQSEFVGVNVDDEAFGGYKPAAPAIGQRYVWVDTLIEKRLDAKRDGLKIVWNLADGKFEFDPWGMKLEQVK